jgi:hypothetical protein
LCKCEGEHAGIDKIFMSSQEKAQSVASADLSVKASPEDLKNRLVRNTPNQAGQDG